ncbi:hypothetical protein XCR_3265 [Xanthomonas campestris pv. raphani 756C]|nr:hypothetical protein XCR_3265 [Xanthomonas campestris pv. raphani 756C]
MLGQRGARLAEVRPQIPNPAAAPLSRNSPMPMLDMRGFDT